jgi:thiol-disulfide isomerase/thioredoxin
MKGKLIVMFLFVLTVGFNNIEKPGLKLVLENYSKSSSLIDRVEYNIHRIDTFAQGDVWNNKGYAIIERSRGDKLFGFKFYGERFDIDQSFIYDGKNGFSISNKEKTYKLETPGKGIMGSPGGQMIVDELFNLEKDYKSVTLTSNSKNYVLKYNFKDDTVYNITDDIKIIELDKKSYLPTRVIRSYKTLGNRAVHQITLSNLKINKDALSTIDKKKRALPEYKMMVDEAIEENSEFINKPIGEISLPILFNEQEKYTLSKGKIILLDFWEVWCSPCVKSLSDVQELQKKYSTELDVLGLVSDDIKNARILLSKKGITYKNLISNQQILKTYKINSFPRYLLVDKSGIIRNEYFGFDSGRIQDDINDLLKH